MITESNLQVRCSRREVLRAAARTGFGLAGAGLLSACHEPVRVLRLGSIPFPGYETFALARMLGWLDARRVRLIDFTSNGEVLRALASRTLELACLTLDEVLVAREAGLDLGVLTVLDISRGADVVMGHPSIATPAQLRGRRIGVDLSASGALMLAEFLDHAGLLLSDVEKVQVGLSDSASALLLGRVDAVITVSPWAQQLAGAGAVRLFDTAQMPDRIIDVLVAKGSAITEHRDVLQQVVNLHYRTLDWMQQQPQESAQRLAPRLGVDAAQVAALFEGLWIPNRGEVRALLESRGRFSSQVDGLQNRLIEAGLLRERQAISPMLQTQFLQEAS